MLRYHVLALTIGLSLILLSAPMATGDSRAGATLDRIEARNAYNYLNRVRQGPGTFSNEIGVDLSEVQPRPTLAWNDILAKVAEEKARDMADRDYFGHVTPEGLGLNVVINKEGYTLAADWVQDKPQNFFESISAGTNTGVETIRFLIVDKDQSGAPHRQHLLGMTQFYAGCMDIGIGYARSPDSNFKTYVSIIIARHNAN